MSEKIALTDKPLCIMVLRVLQGFVSPPSPPSNSGQEVGYNDESHFRRAFKSHVGISPALYLKNRQLKIAAYSWLMITILTENHYFWLNRIAVRRLA
ncbi:AraC family transcriptional regulator [Paenibacillus marchantiophytorum]|uniref:AraC family transcriptional regulator n=1 Tax=Paenibacillus marchantiophytorum TaxID=1619310 RepID=UPI001E632410|nr:AraC family transcriptional regulator [Paenibacillus marchantiophytorum]